MIADTTFIIDIMARDVSAMKKARELEEKGDTIMVCSPTVFELFAGVVLSRKPQQEKSKITTVLSSLPQLVLDSSSASAGGLIYGEQARAGHQIDPEDAMIAGIARVSSEKILTRNIKHFSGIEGVAIETY